MSALSDKLEAARLKARNGGVPFRRTDGALYALLADLLAIIEDVERDKLQDELRSAVKLSGVGAIGRKYVERGTDASILVCRHVLDNDDTRNSTYRYALSLREARRRQIRSGELAEWLRGNGGVNTLYKTRPTATKSNTVRTLHLNAPIVISVGGSVAVTLFRDHRGFFDVVYSGS